MRHLRNYLILKHIDATNTPASLFRQLAHEYPSAGYNIVKQFQKIIQIPRIPGTPYMIFMMEFELVLQRLSNPQEYIFLSPLLVLLFIYLWTSPMFHVPDFLYMHPVKRWYHKKQKGLAFALRNENILKELTYEIEDLSGFVHHGSCCGPCNE